MAKKTPPNSASIGLRHLHLQLAVMELVLGVEDWSQAPWPTSGCSCCIYQCISHHVILDFDHATHNARLWFPRSAPEASGTAETSTEDSISLPLNPGQKCCVSPMWWLEWIQHPVKLPSSMLCCLWWLCIDLNKKNKHKCGELLLRSCVSCKIYKHNLNLDLARMHYSDDKHDTCSTTLSQLSTSVE